MAITVQSWVSSCSFPRWFLAWDAGAQGEWRILNLSASLAFFIFCWYKKGGDIKIKKEVNIMDIRKLRGAKYTPQGQPIAGRENEMVENRAGGVVFKDDLPTLFYKELLTDPKTYYYLSEEQFYRELISNAKRILAQNPTGFFNLLHDASLYTLRPHSWLVALAVAFDSGTDEVKQMARKFLVSHIRSLNYLQEFLAIWKEIHPRKSTTAVKKAVSEWIYAHRDKFDYQAAKYFERNKWSVRDIFRFAHPPLDEWGLKNVAQDVINFAKLGYNAEFSTRFFQLRKRVQKMTAKEAAELIRKENLFREVIPDHLRQEKIVLEALAETSPALSFVKMIPELASAGLLTSGNKTFLALVKEKLQKAAQVLHPFDLAYMAVVYKRGQTLRRNFQPVDEIVRALEDATLKAFYRYKESDENPFHGKIGFLAIDTSASMTNRYNQLEMRPLTAAAIMAKLFGDLAENYYTGSFADKFVFYQFDLSQSFWEIERDLERYGACCSTNAGSAVEYLLYHKLNVDYIVMITDAMTWQGYQLPELLNDYRKMVGKDVPIFLINVVPGYGTTPLDPNDPKSFHLIGVSANVVKTVELAVSGRLDANYVEKIMKTGSL